MVPESFSAPGVGPLNAARMGAHPAVVAQGTVQAKKLHVPKARVLISHQVDCPPKSTLATIKEVNKGRDGNEYAINFLYPAQIFESHREAPDGGRFTEQHMTKKDWKAVQSNTTGWPGSKLTKIQDGGWVRDGEADSE